MPLQMRRRGGRMPKQQQPDALRLAYYRAIKPICDHAHAVFKSTEGEVLRLLGDHLRETRRDGRFDVSKKDEAAELVAKAARKMATMVRPSELHQVAKEFGKKTSDFQREQLDRQVRSAISVPLSAIEKPIRDHLEGFAALNVDLVKTVPDRYFDRVRTDVLAAFADGTRPETLAKMWAGGDEENSPYEMSLNDATRIARDQIGKLNAQLNQDRQEAMGVTGFTWRTMHDGRVREEHEALDGEEFEWSAPPAEGLPGDAVQCRCYAEPNFAPLLVGSES